MPPPTSGAAIISTSVRAGSEIDDLRRTAPQRFQSEEALRLHVVQHENRTLGDHALFCDPPRSEDEGFIEELFGEFPMMGGGPAADVALH